jgi:uncharacterized protein (TIGR02246 family)
MGPDDTKRLLETANDAVSRGDFEGFLEHCTEDTTWTFVGERTLNGKAEVREWMKDAYDTPPRNRVDSLIAEGDSLVAMGEIITVVAGKDVRSEYCDVWRLEGGKLATLRAFVI